MKLFTLFFFVLVVAQAQIKPVDQQYINGENYLLNAGFESGRANWSEVGTATDTLESSIVRFGAQSYKIVASSQTVDLSQVVTKYAAQSAGQQGLASAWIKSTSAIAQVCAVVDSVDTNCVTIESANTWKEYVIPFIMGATNNGIRIKSASDSATTYIDNAFVGVMPATMMPEVSQAQIAGVSYFAGTTNCLWTRTNTALGAFGTDADCVGPTVEVQNIGSWQTTDSDLPRQTINNLPAGQYKATFQAFTFAGISGASVFLAINDGTTTCTSQAAGEDPSFTTSTTVVCYFNYTSAGNRVFELYGAATSGSINVIPNLTNKNLKFILEYYPPKSKIYSGDTIYPHAQLYGTLTYAGATNCGWSVTSTSFINFPADNDCVNPTVTGSLIAPSTKIPAFVLPAGAPQGTYKIIARGSYGFGLTGGRAYFFRMSDGTNVTTSGQIYQSNSIPGQSEITGQITYSSALTVNTTVQIQGSSTSGIAEVVANDSRGALTFEVYYFPPKDNPIIGTFEGIEKCADAYECTDTFSAKVSGTGVVSAENLDWINGNCTNANPRVCTFNTSIFTVAPNCTCVAGTTGKLCNMTNAATTSTQMSVFTYNDVGGSEQVETQIICQKQGSDYKPKTAKAATTTEMMYVPNITRPKACYYAFGGAGSLTAPTNCTTGTCIEYYDSCSAGSPPVKGSAGEYNDLIFANGTWKNTTPILCKLSAFNTTTAAGRFTSSFFITGDNTITTNSNGGYTLNLYAQTPAGGGGDSYWLLECTADAP